MNSIKKSEKVQKHRTAFWAIILIIICTACTSFGQLFFKVGIEIAGFNLGLFTNYNLIIGAIFYLTGAVLLIIALKGGELSVLYPILATSFIWVTLISHFYFNESVSAFKWVGIIMIVIGISIIGKGGRQ